MMTTSLVVLSFSCSAFLLFFFVFFLGVVDAGRVLLHPLDDDHGRTDPAYGFMEMPLSRSNFEIHKPYNLHVSDRYNFSDGVHKFWVHSTDMSLSRTSLTHPRSEARIKGYEYDSGTWQFEGYAYVPEGTTGVCIMQVFGAVNHPTTLMLKFFESKVHYYLGPALADDNVNMSNTWFKVNVIHDADAGALQIFINNELKKEVGNCTTTMHWFQFGAYAQDNYSDYIETHWKDIRVLKKMDN